jgi:hypothetical protein
MLPCHATIGVVQVCAWALGLMDSKVIAIAAMAWNFIFEPPQESDIWSGRARKVVQAFGRNVVYARDVGGHRDIPRALWQVGNCWGEENEAKRATKN